VPRRRRSRRWRTRLQSIRKKLNAAPAAARAALITLAVAATFLAANLVYQIVRKPTEIFYPARHTFNKTPAETWRDYGDLFAEYSTANITPELLAALAQAEGAGNPVAHTYWRWRLSWHPFAVYEPASSAVGMYQMTDAAFAEARHYCIRHHVVVEQGCWLTSMYTRVVPSHAIELASVLLDRGVSTVLADHGASARQKEDLAAVIHLCGAGPAKAFVRRGFRPGEGEKCGDHDVANYLTELDSLKQQFLQLAVSGPTLSQPLKQAGWSGG